MAIIDSVKLPDNSTYEVADNHSGYQTETLTTPLTINGTQETTVEGALGGLNDYGDALADNLAANENVYGAKNLNVYPYKDTTKILNGITFIDNGDGTITVSGTASAITVFDMHLYLDNPCVVENGTYILSGCPSGGGISTYNIRAYEKNQGGTDVIIGNDYGNDVTLTLNGDYYDNNSVHLDLAIVVASGAVISTPITFKPMLRDARIIDPTFVPYAKTNKQLTNDKAERKDLTTIFATGTTNTTGAQIDAGKFFYLNGQFCKALTNIAVNATFTLNTNFKVDSVGEEIKAVENKDTSSFSVSTESGVSLQKAICRNGFVYLQFYFTALANSTKIATITDANYLPEGGNAVGLIATDLSNEIINYPYGSFTGSDVYVYVSGSPTSGGIISFVYPVTGY